ncbi:protein polybromo-1-like protein, partial [Leptotrombidium deliense]
RIKAFKKIKVWPYNQHVELIQRDFPIPMIRVPSVFKDKTEKPREEAEEEDETNLPKVLDMERYNIICDAPENVTLDDGSVYYEQFTIPSGSFKTGDCCYVRTDQGRNLICRIDRIWVDKEGNAFFHGPWFVQPMELPPLTPRMFYPQEVFLSSIEDTNPLLSICDRCAVLDMRDYITRRPTELAEQDIYVCESKYLEHEKKFIKLQKEISRVTHINSGVVEDEFFIFRKPLSIARSEYGADKSVVVARKGQSEIPSPLNIPLASSETENDESNDVVPIVVNEQPVVVAPVASVKKKLTKRLVTGYIIFASEVRKSVVQANPECNFGDISRIIGTEWKNLPSDTKTEYEKKAQKQNEESAREAAREAERLENYPQSPASAHGQLDNGVYECHWGNKCDFQCEDSQDLYDHLISEPMGHIWQSYGEVKDKEEPIFQCLFHGCGRVKKGAQPFPSIQRLIRHCKEVHVTKQNPKLIAPENRSKNFTPSRKSVMSPATPATLSTASAPTVQTTAPQTTSMYRQAYKHAAFSGVLSQSRSTPPPPVLSVAEPCSSGISALHSALAQPTGNSTSSQSATGNMPVLSPFWASGTGTGVQVKPLEPIFVTLPAKQKRLVHTNIYLRYMERLRSDCKHISNWEAQLNATPENTITPDRSQLPTHWLSNGAGNHGNVVNALWALRNFMFQDALKIAKPF